jgi:DNA-binding NarL/FixJ family response regulator
MVIDAHPTLRLGVREVLGRRYEVEEAENGNGALELLTSVGDFDVAIVDLCHQNGQQHNDALSGTAAIRALRKAQPGLGIVAHGPQAQDHAATEAIKAGATAYVVKSSPVEELNRAVDAALESERFVDPAAGRSIGRSALTRRQRQILQLYADGQSTAQSASGSARRPSVRTQRRSSRDSAHAIAPMRWRSAFALR